MKIPLKYKQLYVKLVHTLTQNYMPRALIFAIDVFLVFVAAFITCVLISSIQNRSFDFFLYSTQFSVIVIVQTLCMAVLKSYSGIVRYSSLRDAAKQLQVVLLCMIILLIANQGYYLFSGQRFILNQTIIVYGIIAFPHLFLFRVFVKSSYEIIRRDNPTARALILGVSHEDVAMASGLVSQKTSDFSIVGFLDTKNKTKKNNIFGLSVYKLQDLSHIRKPAEAIIVDEVKLKQLRDQEPDILNQLLDQEFKIYKLPRLQDWESSGSDFERLKEINIEDLLQRSPIKLNNNKLFSVYENKTVLITGAAGSIGSEIVRQLLPFNPSKVILVDQAETPLHELTLELNANSPHTVYEKVIADVRNRHRMQQVFEEFHPEVVFHAAAYKHVPMMEANAIEAISVNFYGTHNVADLAVEYNVSRFTLVSTDKAVNPTNIMGATKRSAELYIQYLSNQKDHQTTFVTTRFGNVLGSNGSVVPYFKKQIAAGGPVTVTHPEITRYFMTIDEACQLVLEAGAMSEGGEIFVFDMGSPIKIKDLAEQMIKLSGRIPNRDIHIEFTGLRPGEKLYEELLADEENTTKTHHEKIMIGNPTNPFTTQELYELSEKLCRLIINHQPTEAVELLKIMVPEYQCEIKQGA